MTDEIEWRPVKGAEDRYEVSNTGLVRTKPRILRAAGSDKNGGHLTVCIGKRRSQYVHRLVAEAFLPPDPTRPWVNHKNGKPKDNRLSNLEWCTPSENIAHGYSHNGRVHHAVIAVIAFDVDGVVVAEYPSYTAAAKAKNITKSAIYYAVKAGSKCAGLYWKKS